MKSRRKRSSSPRLHWEEVPLDQQVIPPRAQENPIPGDIEVSESSNWSSSSGNSPSPPSSPVPLPQIESRDPKARRKKRRSGRGRGGGASEQAREWEGQPLGLVWCLQSFETTQEPHSFGQRTVWDEHSVMHVNETSLPPDEPEPNPAQVISEATPGPSTESDSPSKRGKRRGRVKSRKGKAGGRHRAKNTCHPLDGEECPSDELSIDSSPETYRRLRREEAEDLARQSNLKADAPANQTDPSVLDDDHLTRSP